MKIVIPCIVSFIITAMCTPFVIRFATACNCLDVPGGRRLHGRTTPRWGGAAFFAGVLPFLLIENGNSAITSCAVASIILVGMGLIDDLKPLGWKTKFTGMTIAATIVIFGGDIVVRHIGVYGVLGQIELGWFSVPFTYISIIGITNAINLLDGLDGLAGGVSLLGFLFMGVAALLVGNIAIAVICFAFVGALGAFLLFNFPNARIFMGDTGSLFLGFFLSITAILLTQHSTTPVHSLFPALVLLLPIFDTLRVMCVRLLNGRSPFKADNLHLHYLLVQQKVSSMTVTLLFWGATALLGGIALSLVGKTSLSYLVALFCFTALLSLVAITLARLQPRNDEDPVAASPSGYMGANLEKYKLIDTFNSGLIRTGGMMRLKWVVALSVVLLPAQLFAVTTSPVQDTSVLERFRVYSGPRTPAALSALFTAPVSAHSRQQPAVALSDGAAMVTVSIDAGSENSTSLNVACTGAQLFSLKHTKNETWDIEALPVAGALNASLIVLIGSHSVEVPLTVAPGVPPGTDLSEKGFIAFLGGANASGQPLLDLNGDGRRDYLDDYIYTANYLARPHREAAVSAAATATAGSPTSAAPQEAAPAVQSSYSSSPATGVPVLIKLAPGVAPSTDRHNPNTRNQRARENMKNSAPASDAAPAAAPAQ